MVGTLRLARVAGIAVAILVGGTIFLSVVTSAGERAAGRADIRAGTTAVLPAMIANPSSDAMDRSQVAQANPANGRWADSIIDLLPRVSPYLFSATRSGGKTTVTGYAPDAAAKQSLAGTGTDTAALNLATGAPADFSTDAAAGMKLLLMLDSGELKFDGTSWSLSGKAASPQQVVAIDTAFAALKLAGWRYSVAAVPVPVSTTAAAPPSAPLVAKPFTFSATKAAGGEYTLAGHVGTDIFKHYLAGHLGKVTSDTTAIAGGAPPDFIANVLAGLAALDHLNAGSIAFDGSTWSLNGTPQTADDAKVAIASLAAPGISPSSWKSTIADPVVPATPPVTPPAAQTAATTPGSAEKPAADSKVAATDADATAGSSATVRPGQPDASAATAETIPANPAAAPAPTDQNIAAVQAPVATPAPAPSTPAAPPVFTATRTDGGPLALAGNVPANVPPDYFGALAGNAATDKLALASTLPPDFVSNAGAGIRALVHLSNGKLAFDGSQWTLQGTADTDTERLAALGVLANLPQWHADVAITPPLQICSKDVAAFSARNIIRFQSGKAKLTDDSAKALGELATDLAVCPDESVSVAGYTDADGAADANLVLSVARAEAVVAALVGLGVNEGRLYAIGYGESLPIASNDTNAGKQANRRIVFTMGVPSD